MQMSDNYRRLVAWSAALISIAAITAIEIFLPPGVVIASAYVAVVVVAYLYLSVRHAFLVTVLCTVASVLDAFLSGTESTVQEEVVERTLILGSIWLTAYLMHHRRQLDSKLEDSEARYEAMFNSVADGILMVDTSGVIRDANPAALRILGYAPGALTGQPLDTIIPHKYRAAHAQSVTDYAAGKISIAHLIGVTREVDALRSDGTEFPIDINVSISQGRNGRMFCAVIRDISARRLAELKARESQRALSTLMSNLPGMAYRSQYDAAWTILFVSQGVRALTGYEAHEIEGNRSISFDKIIFPADRDLVRSVIRQAVSDDEPYDITYRIVHRSGEIRWVNEKGRAVPGHDNEPICLEGFISDITREKRVEEAMRESEQRFRSIADSTPIMIWAAGIDSQITFANRRILEFTGLSIDELTGNSWLSHLHPDDVERVAEAYSQAFAAWLPLEIEYRLKRADGEYRWILIAGVPRFAPDGDFMGYIGSGMDIHERKRAEHALRESESRFRIMADSTPFMMFASDTHRQNTFVNSRLIEFTGHSFNDLMGDGWFTLVHPDDADRIAQGYAKAYELRQPFEFEYRLRRADGEYRWIIIAGRPRYEADGTFVGYIGSGMDIHDRKHAEMALRESESRFRTVADSSPMMIWLTAPNGQCTFVNQTWLDFTGRTLDDNLGFGWADRVHPDDQKRVLESFVNAHETRTPWSAEYRLLRHDGVYRWILDQGEPIGDAEGEYAGFAGSSFDFTERREALEELKESEERFRNVANLTPSIIWVADNDTRCTFLNKTWYDLTGQTQEEAFGHGWMGAIHPDDLEAARQSTEAGFAAGMPYENEFRVRAVDGTWRALLNTAAPRRSPDGKVLGYVGSAIDVTDRDRLDQIISHISTGVSSSTGDEFFRLLAKHLADALGADMVSIGELSGGGASRLRTIAIVDDGEIRADIEYELKGTPCEIALSEGQFACADDVQTLFPSDQFLIETESKGYIGHALRDSDGAIQGVIWVLFRRPIPNLQLGLSLMRIFAVRAAAELERRQAMESLRLSEEQFRLSVKASNTIAFRQDTDLRYTWIYNAATRSDQDVVGLTDFDLLPKQQAIVLTTLKREVLRTGIGTRAEVELSPAGTIRYYDLIVEPILDNSGATTGITCVASDVTDRRIMEQALRESEQRYRRLFEHAPIALCEYDLSGVKAKLASLESRAVHDVVSYYKDNPTEYVQLFTNMPGASLNRQALSLFGAESEDYLRDAFRTVATENLINSFSKFIGALQSGCTSFEDEVELRTVTGASRHIIARSMLAPGHEHDWSRVVTSMVDVTSQRRAEEALRLSETRYRRMFQDSPMAKLEVDLSHVKDELVASIGSRTHSLVDALESEPALLERCLGRIRFTSVNSTALRVFHSKNEPELRANIPMLFTERTMAALREFLLRLWTGETTYETETQFRTLDGQTRIGRVHCAITTESDDDWSQVIVAILDVTDSRHAEEELGRAKRLETAGRLAGQIAHDFNNLLGPLVAYPEILQAKFPAEGRAHEMLRDMQNAALQIAEINQELLTLSRRGHYNTDRLDLNALVKTAIRTAEIPPTVVLDCSASPGELAIQGGSAQLMRVMINLLRNAIEAMDEVGTLSIVTDSVYVDEPIHRYATVERGEYARVAIKDTGCGIPPEALEHIFEPFFTTKKADTKRGTGLGLPVVHAVVEDHNGYIDVSSTPGVGTTFTLYFPLYRGDVVVSENVQPLEQGHGETVVFVDDDPLQRRIAEVALERVGYKVIAFECGEDAVRYFGSSSADIAILDMVMGGIDGTETLTRIRSIYPEQPAMILTGYATSERAQAALALGNCELLAKPIQVSTLTSAIHRALGKRDRVAAQASASRQD